jgi:hypothetical protein
MARAASPRPPSPPFSVPKSGSCGLPPPRGESFRLADGNAEILGYLKRHGTSSRQGANAASDRGNQPLEPVTQLHTDVLVINVVCGIDDGWSAVEAYSSTSVPVPGALSTRRRCGPGS